jgi:hypothetical protein
MQSNTLIETGALTAAELEQCRLYVGQTGKAVIAVTRGLSEEQWHFKAAPDCWSIAENVEHMALVQEFVLGPIRAQLAQAPPVSTDRDYKAVEDIVVQRFPVRDQRFPAPEPGRPTGRWTPSAALDLVLANEARLNEYVESTPDIRLRTIEAGPLKAITNGEWTQMDGYQWVLAVAAHTERHVNQILEVKADPGFPS